MSDLIGGLDEVGWGALAGPITSAVVVLRPADLNLLPPGVNDSKVVTTIMRETLYEALCKGVFDAGIGHVFPEEIDRIGPGKALQLSYTRAIGELIHPPDILYVDGKNPVKSWAGKQIVQPKADRTFKVVSAASIIAKVYRDALMDELSKKFPSYNWKSNKGYGTSDHEKAINEFGLLIKDGAYFHRKSFCKKFLGEFNRGN